MTRSRPSRRRSRVFITAPQLLGFLRRIAGAEMKECPTNDPHRCAFYAYTEEGDHMGFHYDTSYYKDRRWTLLVGFKDDSSSRLVCHLHTKNPGHEIEKLELKMTPGMLVLFNGDKVYHAVTPTKAGETRYVVSMQFVTSGDMNPFMRFISNMKDAVAYFGLRGVFGAGKRKPARTARGEQCPRRPGVRCQDGQSEDRRADRARSHGCDRASRRLCADFCRDRSAATSESGE